MLLLLLLSAISFISHSQEADSLEQNEQLKKVEQLQQLLQKTQQNQYVDSLRKMELLDQISHVKESEKLKRDKLLQELEKIEIAETASKAQSRAKIERLKQTEKGTPVILLRDTLFSVYTKVGALIPKERAKNISQKITDLYEDDFFEPEKIIAQPWENSIDITYGDLVIMSVSDLDALWFDQTKQELAEIYVKILKDTILKQKAENSIEKLLVRIGLVFLVVVVFSLLLVGINKLYTRVRNLLIAQKKHWLENLTYKNYVFLTSAQKLNVALVVLKGIKTFFILLLFYLAIPLVFSIFPFTQTWGEQLFGYIWLPFKSIFSAIFNYLPNLFSILVIYFVMKYFIRLVKYIFSEIELGKLELSGFHKDWAMPTFSLVKILLYAFMFILMFPHLPGSDSPIFKGVSVFMGILFSLGSSSAISNMVAGLVITYMRPFKIGDQIKIGDMTGVVIEKNMLVTRLKTTKNEEITIPNSTVLSGNTTNYSVYAQAQEEGLIISTKVGIGYELSWSEAQQTLIEAALRTPLVLAEPQPFVFQTSHDDFYITYEINVYVKEVTKKAGILSTLHKNIQEVFNEKGIELLSPHFVAQRDGNTPIVPQEYQQK
ncbi:mechanosensitive ion channel family protein [Flavobacterium sp. NKUCC04_CG]|uniref:mechanosensitive ion channel family protein n=1 Tax=Flavobacterium sp. NKUCC04_CG TaxID=2842121 RepID=UPI001C5BE04E|nr:mechanosensitive ion channel family protein [Flavobacterium sp. NKUCC04_CG]MBW3517886.1 mechanosensitive ion channel family protein [Flavobacterium sp. NKUCC04_CG]